MTVMVRGEITYACHLSEEDAELIYSFAEENDMSLESAVSELYDDGEIDLYADCDDVDYCTTNIDFVEDD